MRIELVESLTKKLFFVVFFVFLFSLSLVTLEKTKNARTLLPESLDSFYLPSPETLHYAAFGQDRMLADLIWIKTLMYFGSELVGRKKQTWLFNYIKTVIALDPRFEKAYEWGGAALIYNGSEITNESVLKSNYIYEHALRYFPDNWKYPFSLAFNYVHEYNPKDDKERERLRKKALRLFLLASKVPDAPGYVKSMTVTQMNKEGMQMTAIEFVKSAYAAATNKDEKKLLEQRMRSLMKDEDIEKWKHQKELLEKNHESSFSYIPESLYHQLYKVLLIESETGNKKSLESSKEGVKK